MWWRSRTDRLRAAVASLPGRILLEGDAEELLELLRASARALGVEVTSRDSDAVSPDNPASIVVLAIESDGRRSSIMKASTMLDGMRKDFAARAIRIVVVQSGRSRITPERIQRLLVNEILYEVTRAFPALRKHVLWRSFRDRARLTVLDAAGLQVIRFG